MKMIKKILLVFIPLFFIVGVVKVHADDYSSITLNKLNEIRNNQTLLDTVKSVTITYEDDLKNKNRLLALKKLIISQKKMKKDKYVKVRTNPILLPFSLKLR